MKDSDEYNEGSAGAASHHHAIMLAGVQNIAYTEPLRQRTSNEVMKHKSLASN